MKPLDLDMVLKLAREHEVLLTIEEGSIGGFGSHVMQALASTACSTADCGCARWCCRPVPRSRLAERDVCSRRPRRQGHRRQVFEALGKDFKAETVKLA